MQDIVLTQQVEAEKTPQKAKFHWQQWNNSLKWGLFALIFPTLLIATWAIAGQQGSINPLILPSPQVVWASFVDLLLTGEIWLHLQISLARIAYGFAVGMLVAFALGIAMGLSKSVEQYIWPTFKAINLVPVIGWIPLLMLLVGIDEALKIILIAKAAMIPLTINIFKGIRNIPQAHLEVAQVYQLSPMTKFKKLILPGALVSFIGGLRLSLANAWGALVAVELLASSEGIGYLMVYGRQIFQLDVVMVTVFVIGLVGFSLDVIIRLIQRWSMPWQQVQQGDRL